MLSPTKKTRWRGRGTQRCICTSTCSNTQQSPLVFNSLFLPIHEHHIKPFRGWWTKITQTQSPWTTLDYPKGLPKNRLPPKKNYSKCVQLEELLQVRSVYLHCKYPVYFHPHSLYVQCYFSLLFCVQQLFIKKKLLKMVLIEAIQTKLNKAVLSTVLTWNNR